MKRNPIYELWEMICGELSSRSPQVIAHDDIDEELLEQLKDKFEETEGTLAFEKAVNSLIEEFKHKGVTIPFAFDKTTLEFLVVDKDYIDFVANVTPGRGIAEHSARFEKKIAERLSKRLTGAIHRVGSPRRRNAKKAAYGKYLMTLGFDEKALGANDRDGGMDVIWLPPLGVIPLRPIICLQCKNSSFDEPDGNASVGRATRTLNRHPVVNNHQMHFVVFNDYIDDTFHDKSRGMTYVPLGLSDLGTPCMPITSDIL